MQTFGCFFLLFFEAVDRHAIFGLEMLVSSGACVHWLISTDQVLHFRFESAVPFKAA